MSKRSFGLRLGTLFLLFGIGGCGDPEPPPVDPPTDGTPADKVPAGFEPAATKTP